MAYSVNDLIRDVRIEMHGLLGADFNRINHGGGYTASATTLTMELPLGTVAQGQLLVTASMEILYVISVSSQDVVVMRGFYGTTPAAIADDEVIEVGPRYSPLQILTHLRAELRSLPPTLYRVEHVVAPLPSRSRRARLGQADAYRPLEVRRSADTRYDSGRDNFPEVRGCTIERTGPAGSQGQWLSTPEPFDCSHTLYIALAVPFIFDEDIDVDIDLVDDVGMSQSMLDIPLWGTVARLLSFQEVRRQDITRHDQQTTEQSTPALAAVQAANVYFRMRDSRIVDEIHRLDALWPMRGPV
jgi:hypothetical protein